jgi:3-phenylpropionate/trans-cinnamate dioxygenase ferredoxin reductase subunit
MSPRRVVVIGGGAAGAAAVGELRRAGFDGELVLVGDEDRPPYERPPLSKEFLLAAGPAEHVDLLPPNWYAQECVELVLSNPATEVRLAERRVVLADGRRLSYDALVLATGVRARRLAGIEGERVHYLRSASDALALRSALSGVQHVAVLGGGPLGCEIAAAAAQRGRQVTMLTVEDVPMQRSVGTVVGSKLAAIHRDKGVDVRAAEEVTGVTERGGRVHVATGRGTVECDLLVVCGGSVPNTDLAVAAGLDVANGIVVDARMRTAAPGVYAAGDVAAHCHPHYRHPLRIEHHDTAQRHGSFVARDLLGADVPFHEPHWFWSDQYDHTLQAVGAVEPPSDDIVIRGSLEERSFSAITLRDGRIRSVVALNRPRDVLEARRLLFTDHSATAAQLRDESLPLKRLAASPDRRAGTARG